MIRERAKSLELLISQKKKFGTIYIDPPWQYGNKATRNKTDYDTMNLQEIKNLPIEKLAADQAHLHLWTTNAFIFECLPLIEHWGFEYKGMLIWTKPEIGMGNYWRISHEFLLLGVRGKCKFLDRSQRSWVEGKRYRHSHKPEEVRRKIEKVSPEPRLEMFARATTWGWTVWGNQIERTLYDK